MDLKKALLNCLLPPQLRELCAELEVEADRQSQDAMVAALASAKRAKPGRLVEKLTVEQLKNALALLGQPTGGRKEELATRLLESEGRLGKAPGALELAGSKAGEPAIVRGRSGSQRRRGEMGEQTEQYRHKDQAVQRPDVGVQDQFQAKKPPRTFRYDSSLDPAMSWDEQRERDLGEWLLALIERATKEGEKVVFARAQEWNGGGVRIASTADAARVLKDISKPFLNWAGKAERQEMRIPSLPLFVHERHSTKAILDGIRHRKARGATLDLFGDPQMDIRDQLEAYEHKGPWQNRMILGDSLAVMNSLLEFEGLGGQVQMIYIDPPYGVKFGSNFQPFVRKREVKHGGDEDMTREPEMVKAYRDTWELGLHSYLAYLRDRLIVARELLHESGSVFVQISDENLHHLRQVMDEVFGADQFCAEIVFSKTSGRTPKLLSQVSDYLVWYAKNQSKTKFRTVYEPRQPIENPYERYICVETPSGEIIDLSVAQKLGKEPIPAGRLLRLQQATSQGESDRDQREPVVYEGVEYRPPRGRHWSVTAAGMQRVVDKGRAFAVGRTLTWKSYRDDFPFRAISDNWTEGVGQTGFGADKLYVVQTNPEVVQRCLLMTTDPGDLVLAGR